MTRVFSGLQFEDEVRNIARSQYSNSIGQGSEMVDGRERDGVFWNGEFYTVVEATTDKTKVKAEKDGKKTHELVSKLRREGHMARGFLVTLHEPTTDQKSAVKRYERTLKIISFDEFRSLLFDAQSYVSNRSKRRFGSVYDHVKHQHEIPLTDFIEPTLSWVEEQGGPTISDLVERIKTGNKTILIAEYGVGKSMLLRELFHALVKDFRSKQNFRTPIAINLRDHLGQSDPVELLERHARSNAVDPQKLVAAWNAGYVDLLIDGFDELSTRGWTGDIKRLREYRRSSHAVVRQLIKNSPTNVGIIIAGRDAYFDSRAEMRQSLAAPAPSFDICQVHPFDDDQVRAFLRLKGLSGDIPDWIPTRPLLLTYLVTKGLLETALRAETTGEYPRGSAWLSLIEMIADREAEQSVGVDKASLIEFMGILALLARQSSGDQVSFTPQRMEEVFSGITGATILEDERNILLRLPGLGASQGDSSDRSFIDTDLLNACASIPVVRYIQSPHADYTGDNSFVSLSAPLSDVGIETLFMLSERAGLVCGQINAAMSHALKTECPQLAFDIYSLSIRKCELSAYPTFEGIEIDELDLSLDIFDGAKVGFSNCLIDRIILPTPDETNINISFTECLIGSLEGRVSSSDLNSGQFINCEISGFTDEYNVNSQVLETSLPLGLRVLVVTLRKLFRQYGSSRLESALYRGLDQRAKMLVPEIIKLLLQHGFIVQTGRKGKSTYSGTKSKRSEALQIIQSPNTVRSQIIKDCSNLG